MLGTELMELLKSRYPDKLPIVELSPFRQGELVGIQKVIQEIESEITHASNK